MAIKKNFFNIFLIFFLITLIVLNDSSSTPPPPGPANQNPNDSSITPPGTSVPSQPNSSSINSPSSGIGTPNPSGIGNPSTNSNPADNQGTSATNNEEETMATDQLPPGSHNKPCTYDDDCNPSLCCTKGGIQPGECHYINNLHGGTCTSSTNNPITQPQNNIPYDQQPPQNDYYIPQSIRQYLPTKEQIVESFTVYYVILLILGSMILILIILFFYLRKKRPKIRSIKQTIKKSK